MVYPEVLRADRAHYTEVLRVDHDMLRHVFGEWIPWGGLDVEVMDGGLKEANLLRLLGLLDQRARVMMEKLRVVKGEVVWMLAEDAALGSVVEVTTRKNWVIGEGVFDPLLEASGHLLRRWRRGVSIGEALLMQVKEDPDQRVRQRCLQAWLTRGNKDARGEGGRLVGEQEAQARYFLMNGDNGLRVVAASTLGRDARTEEVMEGVVEDREAAVEHRVAARALLGQWRGEEGLEGLEGLEGDLASYSLDLLGVVRGICWQRGEALAVRLRRLGPSALVAMRPEEEQMLYPYLGSAYPDSVRALVLMWLGALGGVRALAKVEAMKVGEAGALREAVDGAKAALRARIEGGGGELGLHSVPSDAAGSLSLKD